MKFNLKRAVETLAKKDLKFLQPMYEAITNSLEADATEIFVKIETEDLLVEELQPKVIGFKITDNGVGFTQKNIDSFLVLWSDTKMKLGCKGSGRFTWLNVFKEIYIESEVSSEGRLIQIPFNIDFDDDKIVKTPAEFNTNKTSIIFKDITDKYFAPELKIDFRPLADIEYIMQSIEKNLLLKLFLLKRKGKVFSVKVQIEDSIREINEKTIPDLASKKFPIYSDISKQTYDFELFYHFIDNRRNSKKIYYCANDRTVKEEDDDALNFSCELPNKVSFDMLLCSSYFDEMVNDSRDDFPGMSNKRQANLGCPLLYKDIKPELLKQMHMVLLEKFPELEDKNEEQVNCNRVFTLFNKIYKKYR